VEIKGYAGHLQIYIDGTMALEYVDNQPLDRGTIALEILEDSHVFFDDLLVTALEESLPPPRLVQEHHGPLVLKGNQEMRIEGMTYIQYGGIHLQDRAKLILWDAKLEIHAEGDPRADIFIEGQAQLIAENASLLPPLVHPDNLYLYASDQAQIHFDHIDELPARGKGGRPLLNGGADQEGPQILDNESGVFSARGSNRTLNINKEPALVFMPKSVQEM